MKRLPHLIPLLIVVLLTACSEKQALVVSDKVAFEASDRIVSMISVPSAFISFTTQSETQLGQTRPVAIVPLVFNQQGHLLTAEEYNSAVAGQKLDGFETYFTDLKTYRAVMKELVKNGNQKQARLDEIEDDFAHLLPTSTDAQDSSFHGNGLYGFDPYESKHLSDQEIAVIYKNQLTHPKDAPKPITTQDFTNSPSVWVADIAVRSPDWAWWWHTGHAGVVTQLNCEGIKCSGDANSPETKAMQANKDNGLTEEELLKRFDPQNSYQNDPIYLLYAPWLSNSEIYNIRDFALRQKPGYFSVWVGKGGNCDGLSSCGWYCSLLVWKAYKTATGKDLDAGGGWWVWPYDLINSSHTVTYHLERP